MNSLNNALVNLGPWSKPSTSGTWHPVPRAQGHVEDDQRRVRHRYGTCEAGWHGAHLAGKGVDEYLHLVKARRRHREAQQQLTL